MKTSKFTDAQIVFVLHQPEEGTAICEVCRKASISEATFYIWRKTYGGLLPSQMCRLAHSLRVRLELTRELLRSWSRPDQLHHLPPQPRRVGHSEPGRREHPRLKPRGVHETGSTSHDVPDWRLSRGPRSRREVQSYRFWSQRLAIRQATVKAGLKTLPTS